MSHNVEVDLIGSLITFPEKASEVLSILEPEQCHDINARKVLYVMGELIAAGKKINLESVGAGLLENGGDVGWLASTVDDLIPSKVRLPHYAQEIVDNFKKRELREHETQQVITDTNGKQKNEAENDGRKSAAALIVELVEATNVQLFHDAEGTSYATFQKEDHSETWPLYSDEFGKWVSYSYYKTHKKAPNKNSLADALNTLSGAAQFEGDERAVYVRTAKVGDSYFIDLCNERWEIIEITERGYSVVKNSPVRFRRTSTMRALPLPREHCEHRELEKLQSCINIKGKDFPLLIVWLMECLRPETPYPILELGGEQGSAKSTTQDRIRDLIDPNRVNLRAAPRKIEDIFVSAANSLVTSYNNLSHLSSTQQDALCTLSTGGGYASRKLYSNMDEAVSETKRPVIMNGISVLATAPDLVSRTIRIELPRISATTRKSDGAVKEAFEKDWPGFFGSLLSAFIRTLAEVHNVHLERLPRMADFATLGEAAQRVFNWKYSFAEVYEENQKSALIRSLDSSPIAMAIQDFVMNHPGGYEGTVKGLLSHLEEYRTESASWPRSSKGLSDILRRHAPTLKAIGIEIYHDPQRHNDGYHIVISCCKQSSRSTRSSRQDDSGQKSAPTAKPEKLRILRNCETDHDAISQMTQISDFVGGDDKAQHIQVTL